MSQAVCEQQSLPDYWPNFYILYIFTLLPFVGYFYHLGNPMFDNIFELVLNYFYIVFVLL